MSKTRASAILGSLLWNLAPAAGLCEDQTIEMFKSAFLPQSVRVDVGDAVKWVWVAGSHTVTSGSPDGAPGTPDEPGRLFDEPLDAEHPAFERRFEELPAGGGIAFFCREHPTQLGFIEVKSGEAAFRVAVVDNVYNPEESFIFEGDTIRWEHEPNEGDHTVTSGLSSRPGDHPGELFDVESTDSSPVFEYAFATAGDYPFFCIPHEEMGMKGIIHVQEKFVRADTSGDGAVDISDAVAILNFLFLGGSVRCCDDALDANDDGEINIGDPVFALNYLFLGGATIPPPFPRPGADRTEDLLLCCHRDA
jgi:plastocyanin